MRIGLIAAMLLIPLSNAASLTGSVVDPVGGHVALALVELVSKTNNYQVQTDGMGVYSFTNLPAGEYKLTFQPQGFKSLVLESIILSEQEEKWISELTVDVGDVADCGHYPPAFQLVPGDGSFGSLAGSVKGAADVDVTLVCRTFSPCRSTKTDSGGRFSFTTLSPGEYGLSFRREGFYPETATGYFFLVKAGLESVYSPVTLERCPDVACDAKLRPPPQIHICE